MGGREDALGLTDGFTAFVPPSHRPLSFCQALDFAPSLVPPTEGETPGPSPAHTWDKGQGRQGTSWPPLPGDPPRAV